MSSRWRRRYEIDKIAMTTNGVLLVAHARTGARPG